MNVEPFAVPCGLKMKKHRILKGRDWLRRGLATAIASRFLNLGTHSILDR